MLRIERRITFTHPLDKASEIFVPAQFCERVELKRKLGFTQDRVNLRVANTVHDIFLDATIHAGNQMMLIQRGATN